MHANEYQAKALSTFLLTEQPFETQREYLMNGLHSECGEVAALIKREIRDNDTIETHKMCLELGDVLWYVANIAKLYGIPLDIVLTANVNKLNARKTAGTIQGSGDNR
jgi:NTP pyrophosphatase (non-canonical NTP hydrolase)